MAGAAQNKAAYHLTISLLCPQVLHTKMMSTLWGPVLGRFEFAHPGGSGTPHIRYLVPKLTIQKAPLGQSISCRSTKYPIEEYRAYHIGVHRPSELARPLQGQQLGLGAYRALDVLKGFRGWVDNLGPL